MNDPRWGKLNGVDQQLREGIKTGYRLVHNGQKTAARASSTMKPQRNGQIAAE